jgi:hypothetical protein
MSRWISACRPLLTSLSLHVLLYLTGIPLALSSNTLTLPNILFVNIIEEKKTVEAKSEPIPARKKKESTEFPPPTNPEEKNHSPSLGKKSEDTPSFTPAKKGENQNRQGLYALQILHVGVVNNVEAGQETNLWPRVPALQGSAV